MVPNPRSTCLQNSFLLHVIKLGGEGGVTRRKRSRFQWLIWASAKSKGHCYLPWNPHSRAHEISLLFFYNMVAKCQQRYFSVSQVTITMLGSEWNWTNSKYPWVFNVVKTILKKQELAIFGDLSTLSLLNPDLKQNSLNSKPMCVALGNTFKLAGSPSVHLHMGRGVRGGGPGDLWVWLSASLIVNPLGQGQS